VRLHNISVCLVGLDLRQRRQLGLGTALVGNLREIRCRDHAPPETHLEAQWRRSNVSNHKLRLEAVVLRGDCINRNISISKNRRKVAAARWGHESRRPVCGVSTLTHQKSGFHWA